MPGPGTHLHILLGVGDQRAVAGAAVAREALLPVTRQPCVVGGHISTLSALSTTGTFSKDVFSQGAVK